jgi:hypothetical protein
MATGRPRGRAGAGDASDANRIVGNRIVRTAAEPIDVKEGTTGGVVRGNVLDGSKLAGANFADSWMDVKGNGWLIEANRGTNAPGSALLDGYQVHQVVDGWGQANVFRANVGDVDAKGYGFDVDSKARGTIVTCDNVANGAAAGLANVPCTPP